MLLPTLIDLRRPEGRELDPEDIFGSSLGGVFTDDLQNQHGDDPETVIVYKNARHGSLEFRTADINGEEERRKMAHYLWNAGVLMAELVGGRPQAGQSVQIDVIGNEGRTQGKWWINKGEEKLWSVEGESVIELGAGALGWTQNEEMADGTSMQALDWAVLSALLPVLIKYAEAVQVYLTLTC
jgi:hypothetical protein